MLPLEAELFADTSLCERELVPYGFVFDGNLYVYETTLPCRMKTVIAIDPRGEVEGHVYDGEEEFEGYRRNALGSYSGAVKDEFLELLKDIKAHCFTRNRKPDYYLLPSNPAVYDVGKGFADHGGLLEWPAGKRVKPGDVVFIYSARPFKGLRFRCEVVSVNEEGAWMYGRRCFPTTLKLIETYDQDQYPLEDLYAHGLKTVRFFHRTGAEFGEYILTNGK